MHLGAVLLLAAGSRPPLPMRCASPLLLAPATDPFRIVGVEPDATAEQVQSAFRRRSRELHPDAGGSAEEFQKLVEAYKLLQDPAARQQLAIAKVDSLDFSDTRGKVYGSSESLRKANVVQAGARDRAARTAERADAAEAGRAAMAQRRARMAKRNAAAKAASAGSDGVQR
jgi:curved DNA-binding protein CbpA